MFVVFAAGFGHGGADVPERQSVPGARRGCRDVGWDACFLAHAWFLIFLPKTPGGRERERGGTPPYFLIRGVLIPLLTTLNNLRPGPTCPPRSWETGVEFVWTTFTTNSAPVSRGQRGCEGPDRCKEKGQRAGGETARGVLVCAPDQSYVTLSLYRLSLPDWRRHRAAENSGHQWPPHQDPDRLPGQDRPGAGLLCTHERGEVERACVLSLPRVINLKIPPATSREILHHTVRRTWLFRTCSDERWLY